MKITITVDNVYSAIISELDDKLIQGLFHALATKNPQVRHSQLVKTKRWDGWTRFFKPVKKQFLTGFLPIVTQYLGEHCPNCVLDIKDTRTVPKKQFSWSLDLKGLAPFDYQIEAPKIIEQKARGFLWLATNAGKTLIAAMTIQRLGVKTLYILNSKELLVQVKDEIEAFLQTKVGILGSGIYSPAPITIATMQTLFLFQQGLKKDSASKLDARKMEIIANTLEETQLIILDECHMYSASEWHKIFLCCPAYYRIGMSGTAMTKKGDPVREARLIGITGGLLYRRIRNKELVEQGISAPPKIHIHECAHPFIPINDFTLVQQWGIVENKERNQLLAKIAWEEFKDGHTVLLFIQIIEHGHILQSIFEEIYDRKVPFVHGKSQLKQRIAVKDAINLNKERLVIASRIFKTGLNLPTLTSIVNAGGRKSEGEILQLLGRGLRTHKGKTAIHVHDIFDKGNKILEEHSKERLRVWKNEKFPMFYL